MTTTVTEPVRRAELPPDVRVTQARVVVSEWVKFRSLRSSYVALVASLGALVGLAALVGTIVANNWPEFGAEERARFDPARVSLSGVFLAQLIIGVLGVLVVSGEYGTGMIRASMSAAPKRLPVLWGKLAVFAAVGFVVTGVGAVVAFFVGQSLLSSQHIETTLGAPGVLRAVLGAALYLTGVGLLGGALGWIFRHTAGAISTLLGLLLVVPLVAQALPESWARNIVPYLPGNAGQQIMAGHVDPGELAPWTGFAWFCAYIVAGVAIAAVLLRRRDA
jgi:ABC-type transport system involved in multi-copper enzyme maturation permease subunit